MSFIIFYVAAPMGVKQSKESNQKFKKSFFLFNFHFGCVKITNKQQKIQTDESVSENSARMFLPVGEARSAVSLTRLSEATIP